MNNKIVVSLALLFLCKTLVLIAGGRQSKAQARIQRSLINRDTENNQALRLFSAIRESDIDKLERMIQRGANLQARHFFGQTALECSIFWGKADAINLLLSHNARVEPLGEPVISLALDSVDRGNLSFATLHWLLKMGKYKQLGAHEQTPQEVLRSGFCGPKRTALLVPALDAVEDSERATVAEVFLMSRRIFPRHCVINGTILSYVSSYKETLQERAQTLAHLPNQY